MPQVKVSVVVAVYNSGELIDLVLDSFDAQSLPPAERELILVDDGSTDGTGERLAAYAGQHADVRYQRIPNSGWPGRPRNIGLDQAQGEYVLFMDHDDAIFPEALERMHAFGVANGADLVIGKEVRAGARTEAPDTFRRNVGRADLVADRVIDTWTPHKLFRRRFLLDHGIRFAEGRRRLEDLHHLAQVYAAAPAVSILADYPCYRWVIRDDNNSVRLPDPVVYYASLRDVLDVTATWPVDEATRDATYLSFFRTTVLGRFGPGGFRTWPGDYQPGFLEQARAIATERFDPRFDQMLPPPLRRRAELLRAGDLTGLLELADADAHVTTRPEVVGAVWDGTALALTVTTVLQGQDGPVRFVRRDGRVLFADRGLDVTDWLDQTRAEVVLADRASDAEWFVPGESTWRLVPLGSGQAADRLEVTTRATLSCEHALLGRPMSPGRWDLRCRTTALGFDSRVAIRVGAEQVPGPAVVAGRRATPYRTKAGRLAIRYAAPPAAAPAGPPATSRPTAGRLAAGLLAAGRATNCVNLPPTNWVYLRVLLLVLL